MYLIGENNLFIIPIVSGTMPGKSEQPVSYSDYLVHVPLIYFGYNLILFIFKKSSDTLAHNFVSQEVDWVALFARRLKPPFVPKLNGQNDVQNFGKEFITQRPILSFSDLRILTSQEQAMFEGFDCLTDLYKDY